MAYRVSLTRRAERDLANIYRVVSAKTSDTAHIWFLRLRETIASLQDNPYRCPTTPEDEHLRYLLYGKKPHVYRVIYRVIEGSKQIVVVHIRHGARSEFSLKIQ